jgi:uncharacterized protein with FMN-binding domain
MTPSSTVRRRRLAGLSGLLAGIGLLVAARAVVGAPTPQQVTMLPAVPPPTTTTTTPPSSGVTSPPTTSAAPAPAGPRTVDGDLVDTPYGPMQVAVVFSGGRIVDVRALQTPNDEDRSVMLAQLAVPVLRQEVLTAQSARIDTVSGATYTSESYAQSVQYAIDHATVSH